MAFYSSYYNVRNHVPEIEKFRVLTLELQYIRSEYGLEKLPLWSSEIRVLALEWQHNCVNMSSKHYLGKLKKIMYWRSIYRLLKMGSKHDSCQVMEFVYKRSTWLLCMLNIGLQSRIAPTEEIRVLAQDLQLNMGSKHDWCKVLKFVYLCSTCILFLQNMGLKHDAPIEEILVLTTN